ncbi:hypothetical protein DAERI_010380 [Deinococcus aerius]|uniref:Uncharacterized protein n=1 Tax=Deinococcus aerius TaxID=200253 RepID=A0A2I9DE32_9DEIO|nr:hypothetical protein DAERI_010380 [Deinococcus aerius]
MLLTRRNGNWAAEFRRTAYDVEAAATWARSHAPREIAELEADWLTKGRES